MGSAIASTPIDVVRVSIVSKYFIICIYLNLLKFTEMKLLQTRLMNQRRIPTASGMLPPHIYNGSIDCFVQVYMV